MSGATSNTTDDAVAIDSGRLSQTILREAPTRLSMPTPGASFVFGTTVRSGSSALPKQTPWANPSTSLFRRVCARVIGPGYSATMQSGSTRYDAGEILAVPAMRKDGRRISIEFTVLPFRDDAGRIEGIAAILRDVTVRFEETRALRRQLAERSIPPRAPAGG
jgi:hypothetical protein